MRVKRKTDGKTGKKRKSSFNDQLKYNSSSKSNTQTVTIQQPSKFTHEAHTSTVDHKSILRYILRELSISDWLSSAK
jgi:hypothetical protein